MFLGLLANQLGASIRLPTGAILTAILTACAVVKVDHDPVPVALVENASVPNFETARTWADEFSPAFLESAKLRLAQAQKTGITRKPERSVLAL
jgi:hypothetical protein